MLKEIMESKKKEVTIELEQNVDFLKYKYKKTKFSNYEKSTSLIEIYYSIYSEIQKCQSFVELEEIQNRIETIFDQELEQMGARQHPRAKF